MQDKHTGEKRSREGAGGPHKDRWHGLGAGRAPWSMWDPRAPLSTASFSQKFLNILKLTRNNFYGIFKVALLTVSRTYSFFRILESSGRFLLCVLRV